MPTKEATSLCKTVLRNGYDAYIVNAPLQTALHEKLGINELDIACEPDFETLSKLFPNLGSKKRSSPPGKAKRRASCTASIPPTSAIRPIPS